MNILYILYTFNRPQILKKSIETLFMNNDTKPTEMLIIDDGSAQEVKDALYQFSKNNQFPIHFISFGANQGLGYNWELAWNFVMARKDKYDYIVQLEQDYVWRKNGIDEAIAVLEAKPEACALSGYENPDYTNSKQDWLFRKVMIEDFGSDPAKREYLHKPFKILTNRGEIEIQLTTNSCGTFIMNWKTVRGLLDTYPEMWGSVFERSFNKPYPDRRKSAGDGPITSGLSYFWYKDVESTEIDYSKEAPWLSICDYSISQHVNGGEDSLNGKIIPEGYTFVGSPKWKDEYLFENPRKKLAEKL